MPIVATVGDALQRLFGELAQTAASEAGVIQRLRKFTPLSLARTFVLGFVRHPQASDEQLAQMAAQCGAEVTPQAIEQRQSARLVDFLERLFRGATQWMVGADKAMAPILERFPRVTVLDSSTIRLPDALQDRFRGCGGTHDTGVAVMKLQTELDLRSGALEHVQIEPGRCADRGTSRQDQRRLPGSLRITDLGYFAITVFAAMHTAGEYFLSRLQFGTYVRYENVTIDILRWLSNRREAFVDVPILLGQDQLPCRMIAWRLPPEQANRRRQKLRAEMKKKKKGRQPSAERLAWCDWTILVTNVPPALLTPSEAAVLYRARWQIELLFKRWKSQGLVEELSGSSVARQMVRVWSRLLAAVVQHWLTVASVWGDPSKSLSKVYEAIRDFASRLAAALDRRTELERVLADMHRTFGKTCNRNKRSNEGTFELLNDVQRLNFGLT